MEFWAGEVKTGEILKVNPGDGMVLHLSQACLGEMKKEKGSESVYLYVGIGGRKLVVGTLFADKLPQQQFDLVFDSNFELSHSGKSGSVYFYGYKAENPYDDEEEFRESDESSGSEEDIPFTHAENGKPDSKEEQLKANEKANATEGKDSDGSKQKVNIVDPKKDDETSDDDSMSEDEDDEEDDDESDDGDESEVDSDEDAPEKVALKKKQVGGSAIKTSVPEKNAKVTPQDGKKGATHVATPHPAKQTVKKTPGDKSKNGKPDSKEEQMKAVENEKANATKVKGSDGSKQKVKIVEPKKDDEISDDDLMSEDEDDEEDDDESGDSDEDTPQKAAPSKKRAGESATKTPVPEKKAKVTPQKTDGKKGAPHEDTPHPAKKTGKKTPGDKSTPQAQKSGGSHSCGSCNRTFGSDKALESHNKAKHAGGK